MRNERDYKDGDNSTKVFTFSDFPKKLEKETWKYLFIQLYQPFEPFCKIGLSLVDLEPQDNFIVPSLSDIEDEEEVEIESNFERMKRSIKEEELKSPKTPKGDPFDQLPKKKEIEKPKKQETEKKTEKKEIEKKSEQKTEKPKKTFKFKSLSSDEEEENKSEKKPEKKEKIKSKLESSSDDEKPVKKKTSIEGILVNLNSLN
jgi:hypothetical protein